MKMVLDIHTEIAELRAELAHCILTYKERADPRRVGRDLSRYAKDHSEKAREELVAEIGSTLLCVISELSLTWNRGPTTPPTWRAG